MKRAKKIPNLSEMVHECIRKENFRDTSHSILRKKQRKISLVDILYILKHGFHESKKDSYQEAYECWNYAFRGNVDYYSHGRMSKKLKEKERKKVKKFVYEGLGFPVLLQNVPMVKIREIWTPDINYSSLQKAVLVALAYRPFPLTGSELEFIRKYFEFTKENFAHQFGTEEIEVSKWEKRKGKIAKISPATEIYVRLFILEKLNFSNEKFRAVFRSIDLFKIAQIQKKDTKLHVLKGVFNTAGRKEIRMAT